jgi:hypothetical protein
VVGIFIIFVAVLWLLKKKSYQGPVSLIRPYSSPVISTDDFLQFLLDLRKYRPALAAADISDRDACREALLESLYSVRIYKVQTLYSYRTALGSQCIPGSSW